MCELVYLDDFREAVAEAKIAEEFAAAIEEGRAEAKEIKAANEVEAVDQLSERLAKITLDTAFIKIDTVSSTASRQRLLRHAVELCRTLKHDLDIELDFAAIIIDKLESKEDD